MTRVNLGLLMCSACGSHGDDAAPELADAPADDAVELGPEFSDDDAADQPAADGALLAHQPDCL